MHICQQMATELDLMCAYVCVCSSPPGLRRTTWHLSDTSTPSSSVDLDPASQQQQQQPAAAAAASSLVDNSEAQQLLSVAANRVWDELYVCKKPVRAGSARLTHTHTRTRAFSGPLSGTTRVSQYHKGKTNLDFTEARDSEWQWHQLGHM